jgi:hypothetical protein
MRSGHVANRSFEPAVPRFLRLPPSTSLIVSLAAVVAVAACSGAEPSVFAPVPAGGSGGKGASGSAGSVQAGKSGAGGSEGGSAGAASGRGGSGGADGGSSGDAGAGSGGEPGADAGAGGEPQAGSAGIAGSPGGNAGEGGGGSEACGDVDADGVLVFEDVHASVTWNCPVYTLTKPIFVRSTNAERVTLTIAPGVVVRGVPGDLEALKFPGALIVTRSGRIEAVGTPDSPIVFTSSLAPGQRAPGDWGGLALLGRSPVNTPENLGDSGNLAGEGYVEGLPRGELSAYGSPSEAIGAGGAGNQAGGAGDGGESASAGAAGAAGGETDPDVVWDCGRLEYVRIEFAGFEVAPANELNSLTLAGCGSGTHIDHVQTHLGSDDGVEVFGGSVDLKHVLVTGPKDDGLDWDQGWRGRAQFVAIGLHDDTDAPPNQKGDSGIEADGYADPVLGFGEPSSPRIFNLTLVASATSVRGIRLREGTQLHLRNAIVVAAPGGAGQGLIDLGDAVTADWVTAGRLSAQNCIFSGSWPALGQADSHGTSYTEADYFTTGAGSAGNDAIAALLSVLPNALDELIPGWVPAANSLAAEDAVVPEEAPDHEGFFDAAAVYRGAFAPGGTDWTVPWAAYPAN